MILNIFDRNESRFLSILGFSLGLRQMALIMFAPFISIYGKSLEGQTPALIGLSLGIYGLTQAIFQTPFGSWSDRYGRKIIVIIGMVQLLVGLLLAAVANHIYLFLFARALQGSGAISAVAYAWIGDRIPNHKRDRGMGILGIIIGIEALLSLIAGPFLYKIFSMPQIFLLCAGIVFISVIIVSLFLKKEKIEFSAKASFSGLLAVARDVTILKVSIAGFTTNYSLFASLYIVPILLERELDPGNFWRIFVPAVFVGILVLYFASRQSDSGFFREVVVIFLGIIALAGAALLIDNVLLIATAFLFIIVGYINMLVILPANITKLAGSGMRGKTTGYFNTIHVIGEFMGASVTGILWGIHQNLPVVLMIALAILGILLIATVDVKRFK
ncbi:MAG: MFS transporter [Calditrichaeota bacterium]|nr:MFS transporter [Calditrichota bacterium]RQW03509.1 MAG: MFS transporter [Calditrichota bacterium]